MNLEPSEQKELLSSPQSYLSKLPRDESERIRAVLMPAYKRGFYIIFIIGGSLSALGFLLAALLMPQVPLKRDDDQQQREEAKQRMEQRSSDEGA